MLTSLEIKNFKGIGARQRIDFAPLTLLFGANSAGKSSILQALVYLHELIERGSADVDRTELGGHVLELGGFARLVHQHGTARGIVLRAESAPGRTLLSRGGLGSDGRRTATASCCPQHSCLPANPRSKTRFVGGDPKAPPRVDALSSPTYRATHALHSSGSVRWGSSATSSTSKCS